MATGIETKFINAYFEAALWSSNDESDDSGGEPLDKNYSADDVAQDTRDKMVADCRSFFKKYSELIEDDDSAAIQRWGRFEKAGHDFWLTRNNHGAGFWDGDWPKHGDELSDAAKSYGEFSLYVGDDGEIHGTPLDSPGAGEAREGHRVADFNTIDELIEHARKEGATHVSYEHDLHGNKLYFPRKDGQYAVANVWQKSGYWHAAKPNDREVVRHLPQGAVTITPHRIRRGGAAEARGGHVEDGDYVVQGCYSDGRIAEEFGLDDEHDAVNEAVRLARSPHFEGDYVRVITRDGELVWDSRPEYAREGVSETSAEAPTTKPGKHGTLYWYEVIYTDPSDDGIGELKQRTWAYNLEHAEEKFYSAPDSGGWRIISIARVPEGGGSMHRATRHRPMRASEAHSVRDYIAVDKNDRRVAGPFKSRHEADGHVPPGGHVKFTTAHRRGAPSPAPSAYPMFREGSSKINFGPGDRVRIRVIGPEGQLADPPFWHTIDYQIDLEDLALQFAQNIQPGMFVSISDGKLSWTFQKETHGGQNAVRRTNKLPTARYREEAGGRARRPKARRAR